MSQKLEFPPISPAVLDAGHSLRHDRVCHDFTLKLYAGTKHKEGIPRGTLVAEIWNDGTATLHAEMGACRERLNRGELSKVEIFDHRDGSLSQTMT